jgi:hypothetical protein
MEPTEPSLDLIVVADLFPGRTLPGAPWSIDKDSLEAFLREGAPSLSLPAGALTFREFRDFRPERLAERLPAAAPAATSPPPAPAPPPAAPPPPPREVPQGGIFDLVQTGPAPEPPAPDVRKTVESLVAAVAGSAGAPARPETRAAPPLLRDVLHHPAFLELESAWRGLRFLVRSVDFRAGAKLHAIAAGRRDLVRAAREVALPFADDLRSQGRVACLLLDFAFESSAADLADAGAIAEAAAPRSVPVLASAGASGAPDEEAWRALRGRPASRWLALAANRVRLRAPYGEDQDPVRGFDFAEGECRAWGRPAWVVGALVASSFARTGWGTDFTGPQAAAGLEPLPVAPPIESVLSEPAAQALSDAGFLPLACRRDSDRVFAASGAAVYDAPKGEPPGSLRHALFAAQVAASLEPLLSYLDPSRGPEEIARTVGAALQILGLTPGGPAYAVEAAPSPEGRPAVRLRIVPCGPPLRGLPPLVLEVPIPLH